MTDFEYLVITLVLTNVLQFIVIVRLIRKSGEYENAVRKIDGIVSGLKPEQPAAPDPRRSLEWKIKR
jgi:hypothetical protein